MLPFYFSRKSFEFFFFLFGFSRNTFAWLLYLLKTFVIINIYFLLNSQHVWCNYGSLSRMDLNQLYIVWLLVVGRYVMSFTYNHRIQWKKRFPCTLVNLVKVYVCRGYFSNLLYTLEKENTLWDNPLSLLNVFKVKLSFLKFNLNKRKDYKRLI